MRTVLKVWFVAALLCCASAALADEVGDVGTIVGLQMNTPPGDAYLQYHGRMFVKSSSGITEYRWGGTSCGSRVLTSDEFAVVQQAFTTKQMRVRPLYQVGQAQSRCIVSVGMVPNKYAKLGLF